MPWINWQSWDYQRYPSYANVCVFFLKRSCKDPGKKTIAKNKMNMIHSPQTHILFSRKRKQRTWFWPGDFGDSGAKWNRSPFPLCKKKSCQELVPPFPNLKRWVCGTMHQIRIVNVFGWIKGIIVHQPPIEKNQSQVVKSFWEDSILDYPSFNFILFGWKLPKSAHRIHNLLSPLVL